MRVKLDEGAVMPTRAHNTDAGIDIYSREEIMIAPGDYGIFHTGVHVEIPEGCCGMLVSKSGLNINEDLTSTGLIDEGYTGEITVKLYNHGTWYHRIEKGQKISQLVILPVRYEEICLASEIKGGDRGDNGLGSTGK